MSPTRHEVMFVGIGGMGALLAGQILVKAGANKYKHVLYSPLYTGSRRGQPCDCTVILSDEEIAAPIMQMVQTVVAVAAPRLKAYEDRVKPGGLIITETAGLTDEVSRDDVKVVKIPALELMFKQGRRVGSNMVMLGAYVGMTKVLPPELVEKEIVSKLTGKGEVLFNKKAFREGLKLAAEAT